MSGTLVNIKKLPTAVSLSESAEMKVVCLLSLALAAAVLLDSVHGTPSQQSDGIVAAGDRCLVCKINM